MGYIVFDIFILPKVVGFILELLSENFALTSYVFLNGALTNIDFDKDVINSYARRIPLIQQELNTNLLMNGGYSTLPSLSSFSIATEPEKTLKDVEDFFKIVAFQLEIMTRGLSKNPKTQTIDILAPKNDTPVKQQNTPVLPLNQSEEAIAMSEMQAKIKGFEVEQVSYKLTDMGGNKELKGQLKALITQQKERNFFEDRGMSLPKGILLYGPPGTGKTLAAKIIAGEMGRRFYSVSPGDILNKFVGESTKIIKALFSEVAENSVIFIDEIDSIGGNRDSRSEFGAELLTQLLQGLDGMKSRSDILIIAATNRIDSLDPALTRSGRLDKHVYVGMPDTLARKEIFRIHIEKHFQIAKIPVLASNLDLDLLAEKSEGLVGADIHEIIRRTVEKAVVESYSSRTDILADTQMLLDSIKSFRDERKNRKEERKIGFR